MKQDQVIAEIRIEASDGILINIIDKEKTSMDEVVKMLKKYAKAYKSLKKRYPHIIGQG
jgi:hypothetical protein